MLLTIIIAIINFLIVFANLYLSNGYVAKTVYEADLRETMQRRDQLNLELRNIAVELRSINDHNQVDIRQDERLKDCESRIRDLEKRH